MRTIFIISLVFLMGCTSMLEMWSPEKYIPETSSEVQQDISFYSDVKAKERAMIYINASYNHLTSNQYDDYGYILPYNHLSKSFEDKGDATAWTSVSLANMCMIQQSGFADLSKDISWVWDTLKVNSITKEGKLLRHPDKAKNDNISNDAMSLWLYMLAMAKYTNCEPIVSEAPKYLKRFIEYGKRNKWVYGKEDMSVLRNRHSLFAVSKMYKLGYNYFDLDIGTSISGLQFSSNVADYVNENEYYCEESSWNVLSCLKILNLEKIHSKRFGGIDGIGTTGNHLFFQQAVIMMIENELVNNPTYDKIEIQKIMEGLGKVGDSINHPNWLFWSGYQYWSTKFPTFNSTNKFLTENFKDTLPNKNNGVKDWGCTPFIWQRVPGEDCNEESNTTYIGTDYLNAFAYTILK